jgi:cytochrome P450
MADLIDTFGGHFMSPVEDPYSIYAELRRNEPVKLLDLPMGPGWIVSRYDDVHTVLTDPLRFSSRANANGIGLVMGRTILEMDGGEHTRHRNLIAPAFVPKALRQDLPDTVRAMCEDLIDSFAADGHADLVDQLAFALPIRVIAHLIGIPLSDFRTFHHWALAIIGFTDDPARGFEAAEKLVELLRPLLEERRREPRDDLMSRLVHGEVEGNALRDEEIFSFLRLLLPAGAETTFRLIGNTLYALLREPALLEQVRTDRGAIDAAVEESLRWESPVQYAARETTCAVSLSGVELAAGAQILVALGSANRDESHYPEPAQFDLRRRPQDHLAFGFGRHFCVGSHLARLEARTAVDTVLDRLPNLRLTPDAACRVVGLAFRSPDKLPVEFG